MIRHILTASLLGAFLVGNNWSVQANELLDGEEIIFNKTKNIPLAAKTYKINKDIAEYDYVFVDVYDNVFIKDSYIGNKKQLYACNIYLEKPEYYDNFICVKDTNLLVESYDLPLGYSYDFNEDRLLFSLPTIQQVMPNSYVVNDGLYDSNNVYFGPSENLGVGFNLGIHIDENDWVVTDGYNKNVLPRINLSEQELQEALDLFNNV